MVKLGKLGSAPSTPTTHDDTKHSDSGSHLLTDGSQASTGQQAFDAGIALGDNIVMGDNSIIGIDTLTFTDVAGTIGGIQNQNLVDKSAAETIAGAWVFSAGLRAAGSFGTSLAAISSNTTLNGTHHVVICDASGGAFAVTLPAASGITGRIYHIKKTDSSGNAVTVDGNASETIDGATTAALSAQYESVMIICTGSEWFVI